MSTPSVTETAAARVLLFGTRRLPRILRDLPVDRLDGSGAVRALVDALPDGPARFIVVGGDGDLGQVLTRLMRAERLDVELGFVPDRPSHTRRIYRIGFGAARRARRGRAQRVPLIRDDTGTALAGRASWQRSDGTPVTGEATVDDTLLFDGAALVDVEPTESMPGLRASVRGRTRLLPRRWVTGRAAQLGTVGAVVVRDGVAGPRPVTRSTFYRHQQSWLLVR
ncbi:peptidase M50 [Mycobacteroides abscessus]|uniref:peptidase M50 n=1 Tax=Mycobacteroides abscessus TaxID=36809 RepID=UPI0009A6C61E|nr:peptidase M50 [Mycobacteroides abscessus]MDM2537578.1 peptidase M50 [Mycobacteroides abscessus]MDM2541931.1 peptidase M50 [Mycobacteroides abscessus]SKH99014.1 peptidase, M50 family protein [Mycobacteroides abscessus subsp. massiliense]SKM09061.1 peptidase, M50 family protein [Mycobacteroides abscessus subsp. massiliense]SLD19382.1 peptidase, M50 family protein [Mycobacteroides abscessus subsp. massiliense]